MIRVPGPRPLAVGISPWQQTLLPVGTGLRPKQNYNVSSFALRQSHTCVLLPLLGEFLHSLGEGKGLSNFDMKPKATKENIDKFYYLKTPKLLCGRKTCHKYKNNDPLGKIAIIAQRVTSSPHHRKSSTKHRRKKDQGPRETIRKAHDTQLMEKTQMFLKCEKMMNLNQ